MFRYMIRTINPKTSSTEDKGIFAGTPNEVKELVADMNRQSPERNWHYICISK